MVEVMFIDEIGGCNCQCRASAMGGMASSFPGSSPFRPTRPIRPIDRSSPFLSERTFGTIPLGMTNKPNFASFAQISSRVLHIIAFLIYKCEYYIQNTMKCVLRCGSNEQHMGNKLRKYQCAYIDVGWQKLEGARFCTSILG